ncbi:MAG TPA: hypothetical protein PLZ84_01090 [Clostridia bacterium]|nr:hypothetical protein [Clostridia bacterium]
MKKGLIIVALTLMLVPQAFAYKSINSIRNTTAYVQMTEQNLC